MDFVNTVMNLRVPQHFDKFLSRSNDWRLLKKGLTPWSYFGILDVPNPLKPDIL
jgi:hypothetical protein